MRYLRKSEIDPLAISMCGLKLGQRVLVVGASDPGLIAGLAAKVGLTGRACMIGESEALTAAAAAAVEKEGALVESFTAPLGALPFDGDAFDVAVMRNTLPAIDAARRAAAMREILRVVRPGGRCIAVDDLPRGGLRGLLGGRTVAGPSPGALAVETLTAAGFRAVRLLAEREGFAFVEGIKAVSHSD
jgi:ubiquinone/menaquinone biosynthesis C-methylase UbiE